MPPAPVRPTRATELNGSFELGFKLKAEASGKKKNMTSEANINRFTLSMEMPSSGYSVPPTAGGSARLCQESIAKVLFHIASGQHSFSVLAQRLTRIAELAFGRRDIATLEAVSQILCNLPMKAARDAGLYYSAIAANRRGDYDEARSILDPLCETASPIIKARSIQALGVIHWYQKDFEESARLHVEAVKAARDVDGVTLLNAFYQTATIKGDSGDHRQPVDDLENLWPIVRVVSRAHPHLFYQYHNEIAVELAAVGRINEARQAIKVAMATPISAAYPEWQETAAELAEPISAPLIALTIAPSIDRESEKSRIVKDHSLFALIIEQAWASLTDPAPRLKHRFTLMKMDKRIRARGPPRAPPFPSSRAPPTPIARCRFRPDVCVDFLSR